MPLDEIVQQFVRDVACATNSSVISIAMENKAFEVLEKQTMGHHEKLHVDLIVIPTDVGPVTIERCA